MCPSDNTIFRKEEISDAFGEFHTDNNDNYSGIKNEINASYFLFFAPYYRTGTCTYNTNKGTQDTHNSTPYLELWKNFPHNYKLEF
jgi:hypothetical protein